MLRPSKREKRIAREKLKLQAQEEKSARLRMAPASDKDVRASKMPGTDKNPRIEKNPNSIAQMQMEWSVAMADQEGHWGWGAPRAWSDEHWNKLINPGLLEFEKLTWAEIWSHNTGGKDRHKKHHDMPINILCDEAKGRWTAIGQTADITFRFRLGGTRRLWGYKQVNKFLLIWWDPDHNIYPTDPN
jgi:hypothetical protein